MVELLEGRLVGRQRENKRTSLQKPHWHRETFGSSQSVLMAASDRERPSIMAGVQTHLSTKAAEETPFQNPKAEAGDKSVSVIL